MNQPEHDSLYYLESAPVPRAIAHMAIPMMTSMVLDLVYNLIDAFFVGQLNHTAMLAALTLAFPFHILLMGVGQIFGIGSGTLIPRLLGEKDFEGARRASATSYYLIFGAGAVLIVLLLPFLDPLVRLFGASGEAFGPTRDFVLVSLLGSPFLIGTIALSEMLRGEGASKASMTGMLLSVAVNIVLDPLLIFGLGLNVAGAALATVLANVAAVAYFTWYLGRRSKVQSVKWDDFRPTKAMLGAIFGVGSSALIFTSLMFVSSLLFNSFAMAYDASVTAAFGVANRITQVVEFLGQGLFVGVVPLLAYAYSSGNHGRLGAVVRTTLTVFFGVTAVLGLAVFAFRTEVLTLFSTDPNVLKYGGELLTAMLAAALFGGLAGIFTDAFQAFGAAGPSQVLSALRGLALVPLLIAGHAWFGLTGVIWALPAAEVLGAAAGGLLWLAQGPGLLALPLERRQEATSPS